MVDKAISSIEKIYRFIANRKGFIIFSLLRIVVVGLGLISNIFIVRKLTIEHYGIYSLVLMVVGFATTFGFSWSSSVILYYGSREKAKTGKLNKTFWARNIILGISLLVITAVFVIFKNNINVYIGKKLALLILVWIYVKVAEDYISRYFLAVKKQVLSIVMSFTARCIFLGLILLTSFDIKTLIVLNIFSNLTVIAYLFGVNKKDIKKIEFDKAFFKEILSFSLWQLFGFSGLYIINFGDTAVIKYFMGTESIGIYNAGYKLFNGLAGFTSVISSYYAGSVSVFVQNNNRVKLSSFFYKERYIIIGSAVLLHVLIIIFSKHIILLIYGERYLDSILVFNILIIGSIFRYIKTFYMIYYNTTKKYKIQQILNIFQSILNIGLDIIFIKWFGLIGPAIGTAIAIGSTLLFSYCYCEKRIKSISSSNQKCFMEINIKARVIFMNELVRKKITNTILKTRKYLSYTNSEIKWVNKIKYINSRNHSLSNLELNESLVSEVLSIWEKFGIKISLKWHQAYISVNGKVDKHYIPENIFYKFIEPKLNRMELCNAYKDKNIYNKIFTEVKTPRTILRNINGMVFNQYYKKVESYNIVDFLKSYPGVYIIKPSLDSGGGKNILKLHISSKNLYIKSKTVSFQEIEDIYGKDFLIQEVLKQHQSLNSIYPYSLNTIRISTLRFNGNIHVLSAVLRLGNNGNYVDNQASGGISCGINKDGTLKNFAVDKYFNKYYTHPFTHASFHNRKIQNYSSLLILVKKLHKYLLYFDMVSWDIAIDKFGVFNLIELNLNGQEINFHQLNNGPLFGDMTGDILEKHLES